jgi:DNA-binding IclR family transcriptional regulator
MVLAAYDYPIRSVEKTMRILDAVANGDDGISLRDLARQMDMSKGTLHRFLATLRVGGYVDQDPATKRYSLGLRFHQFSQSMLRQNTLLARSRPVMRRLVQRWSETVTVAVLDGAEVLYVDAQESTDPLRYSVKAGGRAPAYATALGKVLLAGLGDDEVRRRHAGRRLARYTPHTHTSLVALLRAVRHVRHDGYASDDQEFIDGIRCIAVPIRDYTGRTIAALSISGPAFRFTPSGSHELRTALALAAAEISPGGEGRRPITTREGSEG